MWRHNYTPRIHEFNRVSSHIYNAPTPRTPDQLNPWNPYNRYVRTQQYPQHASPYLDVADRNWTDAIIRNNSPPTVYRTYNSEAPTQRRFLAPLVGNTRQSYNNGRHSQQPRPLRLTTIKPIKTERDEIVSRSQQEQVIDISSGEEEPEGSMVPHEVLNEVAGVPQVVMQAAEAAAMRVSWAARCRQEKRMGSYISGGESVREPLYEPPNLGEDSSIDSSSSSSFLPACFVLDDGKTRNKRRIQPSDQSDSGAMADLSGNGSDETRWGDSSSSSQRNGDIVDDQPVNLSNRLKRCGRTVGTTFFIIHYLVFKLLRDWSDEKRSFLLEVYRITVVYRQFTSFQ